MLANISCAVTPAGMNKWDCLNININVETELTRSAKIKSKWEESAACPLILALPREYIHIYQKISNTVDCRHCRIGHDILLVPLFSRF